MGDAAQDEMEVKAASGQRERVDVDLHLLALRHGDLRIHDGEQRRRIIGSLATIGQQVPVVVIRDAEQLVLIDGYLRVEGLRRLGRDTAMAVMWPLAEVDALLHHRHLTIAKHAAIEDAWLLRRVREHGLTMEDLARRLCRSTSWVSRRLGLLDALPVAVQECIRAGSIAPQGAMKYLVPLARANKRDCEQLVAGLGGTRVSVRELGALYVAWKRADRAGRQRIVEEPLLLLRALWSTDPELEGPATMLRKDLTALAAIGRRARGRARECESLTTDLTRAWRAASEAFAALGATIEAMHAGPEHPTGHPEVA